MNFRENAAILAIDLINEFVSGSVVSPRAAHCIKPAAELINAARKNNIPVFFANDTHDKNDKELLIWGEHAMRGTKGCKVIDEIGITKKDVVIEKHTYDAFVNTNLKQLLDEKSIKTVIVCGLYANICVKFSAIGAYLNGFNIVIAEGTTDAFTEEDYQATIKELKALTNAQIIPYKEIVEDFKNR